MSAANPEDDFDAAKAVVEKLKELTSDRQQRVLRWVCESLGIDLPRAPAAPAPISPSRELPPQSPTTTRVQAERSGQDIKSFMAEKKPRSDQQFATAVAYYYRFVAPANEGRDTVDADSLQEATRLAGRARLVKPKDTLNNAKNQGYLNSVARGEYSINTVGENLIAMTLPGDAIAVGKPKAKRTAARKK